MPSTWTEHRRRVFKTLLFCAVTATGIQTAGSAYAQQGYSSSNLRSQEYQTRQSQTRRFEGIIDQLSTDPNTTRSSQSREDLGRSFNPSQSASPNNRGLATNGLRPIDDDRMSGRESVLSNQSSYGGPLRDEREQAVTLRPRPMTVRRASYEDVTPSQVVTEPLQANRELAQRNTQSHYDSFIEREKQAAGSSTANANATEMIKKIAINLCFVLALAIAGILVYRLIQKGKFANPVDQLRSQGKLKIHQVLEVSRGVNLYLVDGMNSRVLVAVDPSGIKSVNVLPGSFEDAMDETDAYDVANEIEEPIAQPTIKLSRAERRKQAAAPTLDQTSSKEIDENLIKMLLAKGSSAA
ncbi:hypothetical protein LOC67_20510 [Stieleria sp. JC731]|uniref:hypothetical protein n=1 Tax=Pirellulaceae TaxID=2691357 RepID=UPI001E5DD7B8|nr:hypothetical protein [Stieleria sp. JC731]MCC9602939.1 hypothetical protein [Stieleria sp. JC731]